MKKKCVTIENIWELGEQIENIVNNHWALHGNMKEII
jgi:hypothetical protein